MVCLYESVKLHCGSKKIYLETLTSPDFWYENFRRRVDASLLNLLLPRFLRWKKTLVRTGRAESHFQAYFHRQYERRDSVGSNVQYFVFKSLIFNVTSLIQIGKFLGKISNSF